MSSKEKIEPIPYPNRIQPNIVPQKPINSTDSQTQLYFLKNELFSLENKYDNLMKLFSKSEKKIKEQAEELKKLKSSEKNLIKEENINKKIIQKITEEKNNLMKIISENKKYISKLEKKLISGVKNEFLVEQNKILKDKLDILEVENKKIADKEEFIKQEKKNIEEKAKIIQKAIQIKSEEIKKYLTKEKKENNNNNEIDEEIIFNIGKDLKQKEELKIENEKLKNINNENNTLIKSLNEKIQELNFAKNTLTKMLAQKENDINSISAEKASLLDQVNTLQEDKKILNNHIQDLELKIKSKEEEEQKKLEEEKIFNEEQNKVKDYKIKIQILEYANKDLTQKLCNSESQIDILEKSLEKVVQKNEKIEKLYKENVNQNNLFMTEVGTLKTESEKQNIEFNKLKKNNDNNINIINELNKKLHEYEKENLKLMSKLNNQIFEKDFIENNLVKQNNKIMIYSQEQDEKIQKLKEENNILNQEKNKYKQLFEQIYNHSNKLIKEKNITIIRQKIKDIKNISNSICTQNNTYDNSKFIFNYDYCLDNNENDIKNDNKNNGGKIMGDNTNDNTNYINKSLTPIRVDNNSFITSFNDDNNLDQNKSTILGPNINSVRKPDKILEMIRKEKNKKKMVENDIKKIEG